MPPFTPSSVWTDQFNAMSSYIRNDLVRRPDAWTQEDAKFLDVLIRVPVTYGGDWDAAGITLDMTEDFLLASCAATCASDRIFNGGKVEPEALVFLHGSFLSMLDSKSRDVRNVGIAACFESGMCEQPQVRTRLESIMRADVDESVRRNIESRFAHYDVLRMNARWAR